MAPPQLRQGSVGEPQVAEDLFGNTGEDIRGSGGSRFGSLQDIWLRRRHFIPTGGIGRILLRGRGSHCDIGWGRYLHFWKSGRLCFRWGGGRFAVGVVHYSTSSSSRRCSTVGSGSLKWHSEIPIKRNLSLQLKELLPESLLQPRK